MSMSKCTIIQLSSRIFIFNGIWPSPIRNHANGSRILFLATVLYPHLSPTGNLANAPRLLTVMARTLSRMALRMLLPTWASETLSVLEFQCSSLFRLRYFLFKHVNIYSRVIAKSCWQKAISSLEGDFVYSPQIHTC